MSLILGTGPLGLAICDELVARGERPVLVNRSGKVPALPAEGVRVVAADLTRPESLVEVARAERIVYNTTNPPYTEWATLFPPLVRGAIELVRRAEAVMVFSDNLYMYGPTHGKPMREDFPYAATGPKGRIRSQMANEILEAKDIRAVIGRASDFYGPRVRNAVLGDPVLPPALAGKPANLLGNPGAPHTFTFIRDFARALIRLGEAPDTWGRAWHVPSAPAVPIREVLQKLEKILGQPVKSRTAGRFLVHLMSLFNPMMRELKETLYMWEEPYRVDHSAFAARFDDAVTPLDQGLAETVAWFRANSA